MELKRICADISAQNHARMREHCKREGVSIVYLVNKWIEENTKKIAD